MRYSVVYIKPDGDVWRTWRENLPDDREEDDYKPEVYGQYIYPTGSDDEAAFQTLKQVMVNEHHRQIELLQRSLEVLEKLESQ